MLTAWMRRALAVAAGFGLVISWAVASPIGSSADEDYHLASAWCAGGPSSTCQPTTTADGHPAFIVPGEVTGESCYLRGYLDASLDSAGCLNRESVHPELTSRVNSLVGNYPPLYYRFANLFVGSDPAASVIAIRLVNGTLALLTVILALAAARPWIRRGVAAAWLACLIPFAISLVTSVNPSGWVITGVGTFWAFFVTWMTIPRLGSKRGVAAGLGMIVSLGLASAARSDAVLLLGASIVMSLLIGWPSIRPHARRLWLLALPLPLLAWSLRFRLSSLGGIGGLSFGTQASADQGSQGLAALAGDVLRYLAEVPALFAGTLGANTPEFNQAAMFFYGIGSLDVRMPSIVPLLTVSTVGALAFWGLASASKRKLLALAIGVLTFAAVPLLTLTRYRFAFPYSPRYILPFTFVILAIAVISTPWQRLRLSRLQALALGAAFSLANAAALLTTVRRYTNGQAETWLSLRFTADWWWSGVPHPLWVVALGSLSGIAVGFFLALVVRDPRAKTDQASTATITAASGSSSTRNR